MLDKPIRLNTLPSDQLTYFSSLDKYVNDTSQYFGLRLAQIVLTEDEKLKKIKSYSENDAIRNAASKSTKLFNGHIGIISSVNLLDLVKQVDPSEYTFFRCRAIDAGGFEKHGNREDLYGANDNGDYFSVEELLKTTEIEHGKKVHAFETFVGKQFFTNHKNDDVSEAKGIIVNAYYDLEDNCVYADVMLDALANKHLARAISQGYIKDVSMGCAVEWSECSVCHNKAKNINEYCDHIKNHKGRKYASNKVYEINHDLKFIEISAVTDGAFKNCMIDKILSQDELVQEINHISERVNNLSDKNNSIFVKQSIDNLKEIVSKSSTHVNNIINNNDKILVISGIEEITKLSDALDAIKAVVKTMVETPNMDYTFLNDLVEVLSDLQKVIIDLASNGYSEDRGSLGGEDKNPQQEIENPAPTANALPPENPAGETSPTPMGGIPQTQLNDLGNVNNPQARNIKDFVRLSEYNLLKEQYNTTGKKQLLKVSNDIKEIIDQYNSLGLHKEDMEDNNFRFRCEYDDQLGLSTIVCASGLYSMELNEKNGQKSVNSFYDRELIQSKPISKFSNKLYNLFNLNPYTALEYRMKLWKASEGETEVMSKITKTSASDAVLEKQVENMDGNFKRRNDEGNTSILESRLDSIDTSPYTGPSEYLVDGNVTKGKTSNERLGDNPSEGGTGEKQVDAKRSKNDSGISASYGTGEDQFESRSGEYTTNRANEDLAITGEGQLEDENYGNKRLNMAIVSITEEQMKTKRENCSEEVSSGQTKTSKTVAENIISAFSKLTMDDGVSPSQIIEACKLIVEDEDINTELTNKSSNTQIKSKQDLATKVANSIYDKNHECGLFSTDETDNKKWRTILTNALSSFVENEESLKKVIAANVEKRINQLKSVVADQSRVIVAEDKTKELFGDILNNELLETPVSDEWEEVDFTLASSDFGELNKTSNEKEYIKKASEILSDVLKKDHNISVTPKEIEIVSVSDKGQFVVNGLAKIKSTVAQILPEPNDYEGWDVSEDVSENLFSEDVPEDIPLFDNGDEQEDLEWITPDDGFIEDDGLVEDDEFSNDIYTDDAFVDENNVPLASFKKSLKKVYAQQPPVGMPGNGMGGDQNTPPPADNSQGPGVGSMSTPPVPDFTPDEAGGADDMGGSDSEVGTPKFPGYRCPVCGEAKDVEQVEDYTKCGNCGTTFRTNMAIEILESPLNEGQEETENAEEGGEGATEGEDIQTQLDSQPANQTMPMEQPPQNQNPMPAASMFTVHPQVMLITGSNMKPGDIVAPGCRCPSCASVDVYRENSKFKCLSCGTKGKIKVSANKKDASLVDVTVGWFSTPEVKPVKMSSKIYSMYKTKLAKANDIIKQRNAQVLPDDINVVMAELKKQLHEDGYSTKDAAVLSDIIQTSIKKQMLEKNLNSKEDINTMRKTSQRDPLEDVMKFDNSDEEGVEGEDQLKENNFDLSSAPQADAVEVEVDAPEGDEFADTEDANASDIVELGPEDDEDLGVDVADEAIQENAIEIRVNTGEGDVVVNVDDQGHIEVNQDSTMVDEGFEDESPDYFGEDDEVEEDEGASLGEDYDDDDFGEEEGEEENIDEAQEDVAEAEENIENAEDNLEETEEADESEDEEEVTARAELDLIKKSSLMNTRSVLSRSHSFAKTINFDKLASMLNIDTTGMKKTASKQTDILKEKKINFSNPQEIRNMLLKQSNAGQQTMPLDVEDDVVSGVPRDESVGLNQTEPKPIEVKTEKGKKNEHGKGSGGETDVVPRSTGNSGLDGQKATNFNPEKADKLTSGNPDTYYQKLNETIKPTPASSKDNHVAAVKENLKKIASSNSMKESDIRVKEFNGLFIAASKTSDRVWTWGTLTAAPKKDLVVDFDNVEVILSTSGKMKKNKKQKPVAKKKCAPKKSKKCVTASSGSEACGLIATAQNVPSEFLEYAEFDDSFVILDTRNNKDWKIRKSVKKQ